MHIPSVLSAILSVSLALTTTPAAAQPAAYDVVIRNGRVLDGAGNPWVSADVAIKDGRFVKIGRVTGRGVREIDATGDYVSPGWIDMMDQSGRNLRTNGLAQNKIAMGVTTAIAGESGTPVPSNEVRSYFDDLQATGVSINFGTYYGTHQARTEVMGDVAGAPTAAQLEDMKARVATAIEGGAMGVSTALIYPPASFQSTEDLIALASVAARYKTIYASHLRDESEGLLGAIQESIDIAEKAGIQVEIHHLKGAFAPGWGKLMPQAGAMIEAARARNVDIAANVYPYVAGGTGLNITVPNWVFADGRDVGIERLKDPAIRKRLKAEVAAGSQPGWSNLVQASGGWDGVVLANPYNPKYDQYRTKSLAYIGKALGRDPEDVAWDIVIEALPHRAMGTYFMMTEPDVEMALKFPWTSIGSDSGAIADPTNLQALGTPHPRTFGNAPRVIAEYVKRRPVLTLPDAIRKMTSWPATRMRLYDRGVIREGAWADVTVFNYERLDDVATYENPTQTPTGIDYVLVNGQVVLDQGKHTGAKPGQVLRGAGYVAP